MGHMAELYAGYILQAGSRKDFTHYSPRVILLPFLLVPARLAPLSPALLTSVSCSTLPKQGQRYQAVRQSAAPQCFGRTASVCLCWECLTLNMGQVASSKVPAGCRCRADGAEMHILVDPVPASSACSAFVPAVGPHEPWQPHRVGVRLELPYVPHKNTPWPVPWCFLLLPHVPRIPHASQAVHQLQPGRWRSQAWLCSRRGRTPRALFVLGLFTAAEEGGGELAPSPANCPSARPSHTHSPCCEPFLGCTECFHLVPLV